MIKFTVKMSAETKKFFADLKKKLDDPRPMLAKAGVVMVRSIDQNFRSGGRPNKWQPLSPLTKALRRKGHRGGHKFAPLQDTGRLRGSISAKVESKVVRIGTNVEYASLMHFGGMSRGGTVETGGRRFTIGPKRVPARPFVMFQKEDLLALDKIGLKHIEDAAK